MVDAIICFCIILFVALIFFFIGIGQYKTKSHAVNFYTNEQKLNVADENVIIWNKKHGLMWICYGAFIIIGDIMNIIIRNDVFFIITIVVTVVLPLFFNIFIHEKLKKQYLKK